MPFAARLRESEALAKQREIDLANLNELNEFIVQHLRESILVVDESDQVRLINETAAQCCKAARCRAARHSRQCRLAWRTCWKRGASSRRTGATTSVKSSAPMAAR